ncbi:MAG TPA: hypothetical protein VFU38_02645 [Candidatus Krumholzibacteria bacterium]|nr:hypothetical protein [Candidatus Krumholzibacteria bacterium]
MKFHSHYGSTHIAISYSIIVPSQCRRLIACLLVLAIATGCSKAVEIPRVDYDAASQESRTRFRIDMADGTSHNVVHFSLTDSTIVMEKSTPTYSPHKQINETIVARRQDVAAISKYELARGQSFFALSGTFLFVMLILSLRNLDFE